VEGSEQAVTEESAAGPVEPAVDEATQQQRVGWIRAVHNNGEGHHGIHRTVWMLQAAGHHWPKMGRKWPNSSRRVSAARRTVPT
jgi:hypothetical protein